VLKAVGHVVEQIARIRGRVRSTSRSSMEGRSPSTARPTRARSARTRSSAYLAAASGVGAAWGMPLYRYLGAFMRARCRCR
jgi:hypothetical protein